MMGVTVTSAVTSLAALSSSSDIWRLVYTWSVDRAAFTRASSSVLFCRRSDSAHWFICLVDPSSRFSAAWFENSTAIPPSSRRIAVLRWPKTRSVISVSGIWCTFRIASLITRGKMQEAHQNQLLQLEAVKTLVLGVSRAVDGNRLRPIMHHNGAIYVCMLRERRRDDDAVCCGAKR